MTLIIQYLANPYNRKKSRSKVGWFKRGRDGRRTDTTDRNTFPANAVSNEQRRVQNLNSELQIQLVSQKE